jgi:diguanylate cyclase (GGDEF)-like protein/PAS domain S-box-containing protein
MKLNLTSILNHQRLTNYLALLVAVLMLSLTIIYVHGKNLELAKRQKYLFDVAVRQNYNAIKQRLDEMEVILRGVKGYYEASDFVTQQEYYNYINALGLGNHQSGFQAIAVAISVSNKSLPSYLESMYQGGKPNFQIKPTGDRDEYAPISFIEPYSGNNVQAIGFDLLTNPLVKPALLRSKSTGKLAMTSKINLVQDEGGFVPATVMYIPVYDTRMSLSDASERRKAHIGWISGPFRMNDFMSSLAEELSEDIGIHIYADGEKSIEAYLYGETLDDETKGDNLDFLSVQYLEVGGVKWLIEMYPLPVFEKRFVYVGYFPALIGFALSLLLGGLVWLLGNGRAKAIELANEMTRELKDSEANFRSMAETIPLAIYVSLKDGQQTEYVNPTFVSLFGYSKDEINTVDDWWALACPADSYYARVTNEWVDKVQEAITTQAKTEPMEVVVTCKNGLKKYISWRLIALGNKIYAFGYDLTDTKLAEIELQIAATAFESQSGMMVIDANQKILRVNKAFEKITGYSLNDVKGASLTVLNAGSQDEAFYTAMWNEIDDKGYWEGELWNRRKNGEVYPESLNITSVAKNSSIPSYYVGTFNDITSTKAAAEEIQNLAFFDSLTRLPNRRYLLDQLKHALATSKRNDQSGALLFLDLDHFKTLNDTLGHDAGDLLLKKVSERLILCVRENDTVARLGGDEFVLLLEGLKGADLAAQVEVIGFKILNTLSQPYELDGRSYFSSSSIGITLFGSQQSDANVEDLLRQADIAMYQAKASGRNTLRFFNPQMQDIISARASMEIELRAAIQNNQFQLYYQIQVDSDGKILGVEALIRWHHPNKGMVSPIQFIPLAEDTGLIIPIGQWVLETACAQLVAWQKDQLTQQLSISMNVSAKQFHQHDFVPQVKATIAHYDINPSLLKLELTESLLLADVDNTIAIMNELKEVGIRFELDDFGTGYSSLQYLKRLPLSQLKIDQSFVRDIATDSSDRAIVLTIITMANTLGLEVIAEGVETEEQRQYLIENGCMHFQGYLFGQPLPIEELQLLLRLNLETAMI